MLLSGVNPFIQLLIMYPAASWGSTASDLDLPLEDIKEHTPVNIAVSKLLRLSGAKHRSWQTHCIAITGLIPFVLPFSLETLGKGVLNSNDLRLARLLIYGLTIGIATHLFLDALTPEGIHLVPGTKIHLVPDISFFRTGGKWEKIVCGTLFVGTLWLLVLMPLIPYIAPHLPPQATHIFTQMANFFSKK